MRLASFYIAFLLFLMHVISIYPAGKKLKEQLKKKKQPEDLYFVVSSAYSCQI
jgi:hypothetical protein